MKRMRWFLVVIIAALVVAGCGDKKNSATDKTPPPAVEVAPSATAAVLLPAVQSGDAVDQQTSPLPTPVNAQSPLPTPIQ